MALQSFMSLPPGAPRRHEALSTTHQVTFIQGIVLRALTIWNNKRGCLICSETFHLSSGWLQSSHLIWQGSGPTPQPSSLCLFGTYAHRACRQLVPPHVCLPHLSSGVPQAQDHDPSSPGPLQNSPASATTPQKSPPHSGQDRLLKAQMEPTSPVPQIPSMASPFVVPPHVPSPTHNVLLITGTFRGAKEAMDLAGLPCCLTCALCSRNSRCCPHHHVRASPLGD